ncbi:MAG: hypothetical protein U9P38_04320 [Campylobacterota bacterium]|nr:hypothetical protein [Campylobacterota bacterium]
MKLLLLLMLSTLLLAEKSKETCYTVQITSEKNTKANEEYLKSKDYADGCKIMTIGSNQTVRCGCYDDIKDAKKKLISLYDEYTEAYIMSTYKYRFDDTDTIKKQERKKMRKVSKGSRDQCYSVEIENREKTEENIHLLAKKTFPESCITMSLDERLSVRCGCYKDRDTVINDYLALKKRYESSIIKISDVHQFKKRTTKPKIETVDNKVYLEKIASLEELIEDLKNTIKQQELYIENMDEVEQTEESEALIMFDTDRKTESKVEEKKKIDLKEKEMILEDDLQEDEEIVIDEGENIEEDSIIIEDEELQIEDVDLTLGLNETSTEKKNLKKNSLDTKYFIGTSLGLALNQEFDETGLATSFSVGYKYNKNFFIVGEYQATTIYTPAFHYLLTSANYKLDEIYGVAPYAGFVLGLSHNVSKFVDDSLVIGLQIGIEKSLKKYIGFNMDFYSSYRYLMLNENSIEEHDINFGLRYHF